METKILWIGAMAVVGWIAYYLFGRQFVFNFKAAYPTIKKMKAVSDDLIDENAKKYTTTSVIITGVLTLVISAAVLFLFRKRLYCIIAFFGGFLICALMLIGKYGPENRKIFDAFCGAYYRFVKDDALRTAMYNMKPSQMKVRLHEMGISTSWIPEFKSQKD